MCEGSITYQSFAKLLSFEKIVCCDMLKITLLWLMSSCHNNDISNNIRFVDGGSESTKSW